MFRSLKKKMSSARLLRSDADSVHLDYLTVEKLEDRKMLAGDVSVEVDDGDLDIRGENGVEQAIGIEATDVAGTFLITGIDTSVNGQSAITVTGVTGDVDIDMRSGGSLVILTEAGQNELLIQGDLEIDTRGGDADIILLDTVHVRGETSISTRGGGDSVNMIGGVYDDEFSLNTGGGADAVTSVNNIVFGDEVEVRMGTGDDYLIMATVTATSDDADFRMGGGNDLAFFIDATFDELSVNGNGRFDELAQFNVAFNEFDERSIEDDFNDGFAAAVANARAEVAAYDDAIGLVAFFQLGN